MTGSSLRSPEDSTAMHKEQAQQRADRIRAFQEELALLEKDKVLALPEDQRRRLFAYHDEVLRSLAGQYDVDTTAGQKQMSVGMRIISFLGAAAISAALFFFFYRIWGLISTPIQVAVLLLGPVLAALGVEFASRKEKTLYFAAIIGLVAFACFVLNLSVLGQIFGITPTQNAFFAWALFAFILAYTYGLRILLVAGIISLIGYLSATVGTWSGCYWLSFGERPENFIAAGLVLFGIAFVPHRSYYEFPPLYRVFGLLSVFISILILANWGRISYLMFEPKQVEHLYQIAGFVSAGLVIWLGIKRHWPGVTNLGSTFFAIFLYTKFYDWWWDWMPKYLFFLVIGLVAILLLLILKRLRAMSKEVAL
jgi:uncharacterized membrane protein